MTEALREVQIDLLLEERLTEARLEGQTDLLRKELIDLPTAPLGGGAAGGAADRSG